MIYSHDDGDGWGWGWWGWWGMRMIKYHVTIMAQSRWQASSISHLIRSPVTHEPVHLGPTPQLWVGCQVVVTNSTVTSETEGHGGHIPKLNQWFWGSQGPILATAWPRPSLQMSTGDLLLEKRKPSPKTKPAISASWGKIQWWTILSYRIHMLILL